VVKLLLDNRANINHASSQGFLNEVNATIALGFAAYYGHKSVKRSCGQWHDKYQVDNHGGLASTTLQKEHNWSASTTC